MKTMANKFLDGEGVKVLWREIQALLTGTAIELNLAINKATTNLSQNITNLRIQIEDARVRLSALEADLQSFKNAESDRITTIANNVVNSAIALLKKDAPSNCSDFEQVSDYITDILTRLEALENANESNDENIDPNLGGNTGDNPNFNPDPDVDIPPDPSNNAEA